MSPRGIHCEGTGGEREFGKGQKSNGNADFRMVPEVYEKKEVKWAGRFAKIL